MNTPVSFPLARLLKDKNIHILSAKSMYASNGELTDAVYDFDDWCFAPTISDVVMWIYKNHKIWISVDIEGEKFDIFYFLAYRNHEERVKEYMKKLNDENYHTNYKTPKEAYEAAIEYTLNNLI